VEKEKEEVASLNSLDVECMCFSGCLVLNVLKTKEPPRERKYDDLEEKKSHREREIAMTSNIRK